MVDDDIQDTFLSITTSAEIHNPHVSPAKSIVCSPLRSNTPMPPDMISFGTELHGLNRISEDNVVSIFSSHPTSSSIFGTDTSATSSASGASSECSSPSSTVMSGRDVNLRLTLQKKEGNAEKKTGWIQEENYC